MPEALAQVKKALGADAVILGTRTLPGGRVEISARVAEPSQAPPAKTAADVPARPAAEVAPAKSTPSVGALPRSIPESLHSYYVKLVRAEVEEQLARHIVQQASRRPGGRTDADVLNAIRQVVRDLLPKVSDARMAAGQRQRLALVGPPGAGKTSTIAKLAAHFKLRKRRSVGVLSLDAYRPGGHDQMQKLAGLLEIGFAAAQSISGVRTALGRLADAEIILVDTPGVSWRDKARFVRLAALLRAVRPDEVHLALPASLSAGVQERAVRAFEPLGCSRLVLTRIDEAIGFCAVLNVIGRFSHGISFVSNGQRVPTDLAEAGRDQVVELLLSGL